MSAFNSRRFRTLLLISTCTKLPIDVNFIVNTLKVLTLQTLESKVQHYLNTLCSDSAWLESYDKRYPKFTTNKERLETSLRSEFSDPKKRGSIECKFGQGLAVLRHDFDVKKLKVIGESMKVGVITGTADKTIPHTCSDTIAANTPGCALRKVHGKSHGLPYEGEFDIINLLDFIMCSSEKSEEQCKIF